MAHTSTPFKTQIESIQQKITVAKFVTCFHVQCNHACCHCWLRVQMCFGIAWVVWRPYCRLRIKSTLITFQIGFHFTLPLSRFGFTFQMEPKCWLVCHDDKYGIIHAIKPIFKPICEVCVCARVFRSVNSMVMISVLAACMTWHTGRTLNGFFSSC